MTRTVLTLFAVALAATLAGPPVGAADDPDDDWIRKPPFPGSTYLVPFLPTYRVGIGIDPPLSRLHLQDAIGTNNGAAERIQFSNTVGSIGTYGLNVTSTKFVGKGGQIGVSAETSFDGPQDGTALGRLAQSSSFSANGTFIGVFGSSTPTALFASAGKVSFGTGGSFFANPGANPLNISNSGGTTWVGGAYAEVSGTFNSTPNPGAIAAVIGIDKAGGSATHWAGYFQGRSFFSDRVGVATAAPESLLHLRGSFAGNQGITVSDIATDDPAFRFYSKSATRWGVSSSTANGEFIIRQLDSNWMTAPNGYHFSIVAGTGNVGIGLQPADLPPTQKLDVKGTARLRALPSGPGTPVVADANGVLLKQSSSLRYKTNVRDLQVDPEQVLELQPVRFQWKSTGQEDIGLIAEEVEAVLPDLVIHEKGQPEGVKYAQLPVYLLAVTKQQRAEIESLRAENQELGRRLAALETIARQQAEKQPPRQ